MTWHSEAIGQSMDEDDLPVAERLKIGKEWVKKYHEDVKEKGGSYMTYDAVMAKLSDKKVIYVWIFFHYFIHISQIINSYSLVIIGIF